MSDAKRVTHSKSHAVHLNVWFTISHMIDDVIKGNKGIMKKEKKENDNNNKKDKNEKNKKKSQKTERRRV